MYLSYTVSKCLFVFSVNNMASVFPTLSSTYQLFRQMTFLPKIACVFGLAAKPSNLALHNPQFLQLLFILLTWLQVLQRVLARENSCLSIYLSAIVRKWLLDFRWNTRNSWFKRCIIRKFVFVMLIRKLALVSGGQLCLCIYLSSILPNCFTTLPQQQQKIHCSLLCR